MVFQRSSGKACLMGCVSYCSFSVEEPPAVRNVFRGIIAIPRTDHRFLLHSTAVRRSYTTNLHPPSHRNPQQRSSSGTAKDSSCRSSSSSSSNSGRKQQLAAAAPPPPPLTSAGAVNTTNSRTPGLMPYRAVAVVQSRGSPNSHLASLAADLLFRMIILAAVRLAKYMPKAAGSF